MGHTWQAAHLWFRFPSSQEVSPHQLAQNHVKCLTGSRFCNSSFLNASPLEDTSKPTALLDIVYVLHSCTETLTLRQKMQQQRKSYKLESIHTTHWDSHPPKRPRFPSRSIKNASAGPPVPIHGSTSARCTLGTSEGSACQLALRQTLFLPRRHTANSQHSQSFRGSLGQPGLDNTLTSHSGISIQWDLLLITP